MDYKRELEKIENIFNERKNEKTRLEERLKVLTEQKKQLLEELESEGFKEEELGDDIKGLEKRLTEGIEKCKNLLGIE